MTRKRRIAVTTLAVATLAAASLVAGCSGDVDPLRAALVGTGGAPGPVAVPDFVERSRRDGIGYMPVGLDAPRRQGRPRSSEAQRDLEADLARARERNAMRGRAAQGAGRGAGESSRTPAAPDE